MKTQVIDAIEAAGRAFGDGELAFLALTSKVERPFLDRVAYALHRRLPSPGTHVAREFPIAAAGRADIAILRGGVLACILEGKAMAVADCTRPEPRRREYADLVQRDLNRYRDAPVLGAEIYSLLLGVHPLKRIATELRSVVKYVSLLNGAYSRLGTAKRICEEADVSLRSYVREDAIAGCGVLEGGEAFGVPVEVRWWCFGPFVSPQNLRVLRDDAA